MTLTQSVVYTGEMEDLGNYLLTAQAGLDVDLGADLSFRTAVTNTYDSTPGAGLEKNDLVLSAGVALRF